MNNMQRLAAAICLSIYGAAFLIVAGLWPVDDSSTITIAVTGWGAAFIAYRLIKGMD